MHQVGHFIDGRHVGGPNGSDRRVAPAFDPATGSRTSEVALATEEVVDVAVTAALREQRTWGSSTLHQRTELMFRLRQVLDANRGQLARVVSNEHGTVISDALRKMSRGMRQSLRVGCTPRCTPLATSVAQACGLLGKPRPPTTGGSPRRSGPAQTAPGPAQQAERGRTATHPVGAAI